MMKILNNFRTKNYILNQKITFWTLQICLILLLGCHQNGSSKKTLQEVKEKLSKASTISYKYNSETDNKFNETKYSDAAEIEYYKIENSLYGFGLRALSNEEEYLFDGRNFEKLKHSDKIRVVYEKEAIEKDSNYFYNLSFFSTNPIRIKEYSEFATIKDSIIGGVSYYIYKDEAQTISKSDSSKIVKYQKFFYVDAKLNDIIQVKDLTIRNDETLQIIDHNFSAYKFNNSGQKYPIFDQNDKFQYKTIKEEEEYEEFTFTPIKEGEILSKKTYTDVNQKAINIYGDPPHLSLIMFSFIGCAPCEKALIDFKEAKYNFTPRIKLYYSSFQNTSSSLKNYLEKKGFPYQAFSKESNMIEAFSLYHSPSFVLIDSNGKVMKVIEGYDDEVKNTLFELLMPK